MLFTIAMNRYEPDGVLAFDPPVQRPDWIDRQFRRYLLAGLAPTCRGRTGLVKDEA